jgi:hypothetical protein
MSLTMKNDNYHSNNDILFSNNFVKCYSDHLVIDLYYFPYGDKKVKYSEIQSCELIPMSEMPFYKVKMWGMALSPIWWHADLRRHGRESCIVLDTNHWPKIGLTMDDNDIAIVYKLIKERINPNESLMNIEKQ